MNKRLDGRLESFDLMRKMAREGWCVVLKVLPKEIGWLIQGSRSEYDSPCKGKYVGKGMWCAEAQWMKFEKGSSWRHSESAMAKTPECALAKLYAQTRKDTE